MGRFDPPPWRVSSSGPLLVVDHLWIKSQNGAGGQF